MARQRDLYNRWAQEMGRSELFRAGERVGVGVSGGPDSVLLLEFMRHLKGELGLTLSIVHFNHHLRGAESDADERFVRSLAEAHGLEFLREEAEVAEIARKRHRNLEAAARELRYQFFFSLVNSGRLNKVATAHTATDQAETVLLKLLRGTGTRGLGGIYPVLEGNVVRPFLTLTREEVERELKNRRLDFRVDSSNRDVRFRRNKIRLELLPLLRRDFNPEVVTLLKELADRARDDEAVLEQQASERARTWRVREGREERVPVRPLLGFPPAIARRVLRQMVQAASNTLRGVTHRHVEALRRFAAEAQSGRTLSLPNNFVARKEFDWLTIAPGSREPCPAGFSYPVRVPGEVFVTELDVTFRFKIVKPGGYGKAYNGCEAAGLDPQKLSEGLKLRNWRAGDRFQPVGSKRPWKLKELFRERRIPSSQRKLWPVLESGKEIVWVRGFPPAFPAAASTDSRAVLVIEEATRAAV